MQKSLIETNTKRKRRMAKDNNPPNKFKVSPWLVYTAILLIFFYLLVSTGSSVYKNHQA
jgi:thiosulfate reductase cytochrome b subunit